MFTKVTVFFVAFILTIVCAAPGYYGDYHQHHHTTLPVATSYSSRIDYHQPEYIKTYAVASPIVKTVLPTYGYHHQEPLLGYGTYGGGYGYGYGGHGGYGHDGLGYGIDGHNLGHYSY